MFEAQQSDFPHTSPFPGARRLRTDDWPERSRTAIFREQFGRDRIRVEPLADHPFQIDVMIAKLPGLGLVWGRRSPLRSDFLDGSDRLLFSTSDGAIAAQSGREVELHAGDAVVLSGADLGQFVTLAPAPIVTIEFPGGSLGRMLRDAGASFARRIRKDEPALQLLRAYLRTFLSLDGKAPAPLRAFAISHIHDLAAVALGPSSEHGEVARRRGVAAARLKAIKGDILRHLESEVLIDDVAHRHSLSPRYIRKLFEHEGTSFTEFVRTERLNRVRRKLLTSNCRISDVAYSVGFNDLSYFNRAFRERFGCSPGEMREGAAPHLSA